MPRKVQMDHMARKVPFAAMSTDKDLSLSQDIGTK